MPIRMALLTSMNSILQKTPKAAAEYEFLDRDKDGKLNMDEFKAGATDRYNMYDQNRDNLLSNPEYRGDIGFPILKLYF